MPAAEARPILIPLKTETRSTGGVHPGWLTLGPGKGSLVISGHYWLSDYQTLDASPSASAHMQQTLEENRSYQQRIEILERELAELRAELRDFLRSMAPPPRKVAKAQAKREIQAFFDEHHGETLYPSDVSAALSLDYDLVLDLIEHLESEGQVAKAEG